MSRRANPRVIGGFVLGALLLVVAGILVLGSGALFRDTVTFVSYFDATVSGLNPGAPVKFRGVELGQVRDVRLNIAGASRLLDTDFRIPVIYELDMARIRSRGGANTSDLRNPLVVDSLIDLGMRAQLTLESLVTGRQYIALDIFPGSAEQYVEGGGPFREIPVIQLEGFAELQQELFELVAELGAIHFDSLFLAATSAVQSIDELVSTPQLGVLLDSLVASVGQIAETFRVAEMTMAHLDSTVVPMREQMTETSEAANLALDEAAAAAANLGALLAPGSPVLVRLEEALANFTQATRALRALAEELERNPSAVIRGRANDP